MRRNSSRIFRGNKGALRVPLLSFQYLRRPRCAAKLLCYHIVGEFESHRLQVRGLRKGEIAGLRWEDYTGQELKVQRSMWNGIINEPKTKASGAAVTRWV